MEQVVSTDREAVASSIRVSFKMEMSPFYSFNRLKEQEREEASYGCLKERDKENRKEERSETRSVGERRVKKNGSDEVAECKQGACCQQR